MNKELIKELGIDEKLGLKEMLETLEEKQFEYLERLETVNDDARREQLELTLSRIDQEIIDVKEQIKTVKSGIILDDPANDKTAKEEKKAAEKKKKEEKKKEQKKKEEKAAEVSNKVEEIKAKETKKAKEAQGKEKQEKQKAADTSGQNTAQKGNDSSASNGTDPSAQTKQSASSATDQQTKPAAGSNTNSQQGAAPDFSNGLSEYQKKNYSSAFEIFRKLSEADDETAQYMLANMYARGEGTQKNQERAEFWMKKSADGGFVTAQLDYGILKLTQDAGDEDKDLSAQVTEGLRYLAMAADQNDKQAMMKYIEAAQNNLGGKEAAEKAMTYCDKLKAQCQDSFDVKSYEDKKKELNVKRKRYLKSGRLKGTATAYTVIGAILAVVGLLYLFGGIHPDMWEKYMGLLPDAHGYMILPIRPLKKFLKTIMTINGIFGLQLLVLAEMFFCGSGLYKGNKVVEKLPGLCSYLCGIAFILHFVALYVEGRSFFTALGWYLIIIVVTYIVGIIIGELLRKISGLG
jgi:TPR repeat protein